MKAGSRSEMLDVRLYSAYDPNMGVAFCFDGIHNSVSKDHVIMLGSFNPPGNYYKPPMDAENTFLCCSIDPESPIISPKYAKDFVMLKSLDPTLFKQLIIDLYSISKENGQEKLMNIGWTILPMFCKLGPNFFVNSGNFQVFF